MLQYVSEKSLTQAHLSVCVCVGGAVVGIKNPWKTRTTVFSLLPPPALAVLWTGGSSQQLRAVITCFIKRAWPGPSPAVEEGGDSASRDDLAFEPLFLPPFDLRQLFSCSACLLNCELWAMMPLHKLSWVLIDRIVKANVPVVLTMCQEISRTLPMSFYLILTTAQWEVDGRVNRSFG